MPSRPKTLPTFMSTTYPERRDGIYETEQGSNLNFVSIHVLRCVALRYSFQTICSHVSSSSSIPSTNRTWRRSWCIDLSRGLVFSNPSPRFVSNMENAFVKMFIKLLIDRLHLELVNCNDRHNFTRSGDSVRLGVDLQDLIGQQCHKLPRVLSFISPEQSSFAYDI